MNREKEIYSIYCELISVHKKFLNRLPDNESISDISGQLKALIERHGKTKFCVCMCRALLDWYKDYISFAEINVLDYYTTMWRFHKKWIVSDADWGEITERALCLGGIYPDKCKGMILAIVDEIERYEKASRRGE